MGRPDEVPGDAAAGEHGVGLARAVGLPPTRRTDGLTPTDTTRAVNGPGPSWTSAEDWESEFDAYTRQRRSDTDIRTVVADPDKRGAGYTERSSSPTHENAAARRVPSTWNRTLELRRSHPQPPASQTRASNAFGPGLSLSCSTAGQPPKPHRPPQVEHRAHQNDAAVAINANHRERIRLRNAAGRTSQRRECPSTVNRAAVHLSTPRSCAKIRPRA